MSRKPVRWAFIVLALACALAGAFTWLNPHMARELADRAMRRLPEPIRVALLPKPDPLAERLSERGLALGRPAFVRIFKEQAELEVWMKGDERYELYRTYPICRYSGALGPKLKEGDRQAPEGFYAVNRKQLHPGSRHHLAFNIGFPNAYDRAHGRTGSYLMVHGGCSSIGCYAMTDRAVDDIYRIVEAALVGGQDHVPVHVFPFRMTAERLAAAAGARWTDFWRNLKTGYDLFEKTGVPPMAFACGENYRFRPDGGCQPITGW